MSNQVRLEALKLAVAAGGSIPLAVEFEAYIVLGDASELEVAQEPDVAPEPEIVQDALLETPANKRRQRRKGRR